jgi:hypothetical protein
MSHCDGTGIVVHTPLLRPVVQKNCHGTADAASSPER